MGLTSDALFLEFDLNMNFNVDMDFRIGSAIDV